MLSEFSSSVQQVRQTIVESSELTGHWYQSGTQKVPVENDVIGLANALPQLIARRGRRIVVKLGGSLMDDGPVLAAIVQDFVLMQLFGQKIVVVHGGGKAIDRALAAEGITPKKVNGRRVTDSATLKVVIQVLGQDVNQELVSKIAELGGQAVGLSNALCGERITAPDLGFVGTVRSVDLSSLNATVDTGVIPVIPSVATTTQGQWLNINADDAAAAVAKRWRADVLVFLSDIPGVLADRLDPDSRIGQISLADAKHLIKSGAIEGGMVPKVQGCLDAVAQGVGSVMILDGREPHALLMETLSGHCPGTEFTA